LGVAKPRDDLSQASLQDDSHLMRLSFLTSADEHGHDWTHSLFIVSLSLSVSIVVCSIIIQLGRQIAAEQRLKKEAASLCAGMRHPPSLAPTQRDKAVMDECTALASQHQDVCASRAHAEAKAPKELRYIYAACIMERASALDAQLPDAAISKRP
jgi:hypothetical protein